jgi:hypothetical protein
MKHHPVARIDSYVTIEVFADAEYRTNRVHNFQVTTISASS